MNKHNLPPAPTGPITLDLDQAQRAHELVLAALIAAEPEHRTVAAYSLVGQLAALFDLAAITHAPASTRKTTNACSTVRHVADELRDWLAGRPAPTERHAVRDMTRPYVPDLRDYQTPGAHQ